MNSSIDNKNINQKQNSNTIIKNVNNPDKNNENRKNNEITNNILKKNELQNEMDLYFQQLVKSKL